MILFKPNVRFVRFRKEIRLAMDVCDAVWERYGVSECVITSGNDSKHKDGSKHYDDNAIDVRSKNLPTSGIKHEVLAELRQKLGSDYDVLLEAELTPNEHFHIEYDPK